MVIKHGSDYVTWFDDDEYIGTEVSFPSGSVWKLDTKIKEHSYIEPQRECEELGINSEARGAFICSKVSGDGPPTAVIKIRLQIPWRKTVTKRPDIRAKQAISKPTSSFDSEIEALNYLTKAQCSSTPALLSWKQEEQTYDEWVPGGYKLSILMEKVPGCDPSDVFDHIPRHERDSLRKAFKAAWLETVRCGVVHLDEAIYNLIWDKQGDKCYLVDWEHWCFPDKKTVWEDRNYISWHLAQEGPSHDLFNMADWEL